MTDKLDLIESRPEWRTEIDLTLEKWRRFLLGVQKSPGGVHHLFVIPGMRQSMNGFGAFLQSRVEPGFSAALSQKAVEQIVKAIKKNPERIASSETHQVHLATRRLWDLDHDE